MKILISFSVPQNTGDLALIESLEYLIRKTHKECNIVIASDYPSINLDSHKKTKLIYDLEFSLFQDQNKHKQWVLSSIEMMAKKLRFFNLLKMYGFWKTSELIIFENHSKTADAVILCPGSYLNEYYDLDFKLNKINKISNLNSNILIIGQSIGPISKKNNKQLLRNILKKIRYISVREKISKELLKSITTADIFLTQDLAFILYEKYPGLFRKKTKKHPTNFVLSIRNWKDDKYEILEKFERLIRYILSYSADNTITFLSTCQGQINYIDDSLMAYQLLDLVPELKSRINVDDTYHNTFDLIQKYSYFDCYIGMRLHGGILAMLGGTPGMIIGYEHKSLGIYSSLKLEKYHCMYKDPVDRWIEKVNYIFEDFELLSSNLKLKLERQVEFINSVFPSI